MEIENSFLMWVGAGDYANADVFSEEAVALGLSKRLPGVGMATALAAPGTVVFVAHDNGEYDTCDECLGDVECGACRVRQGKITKHEADAEKVLKHYSNEADMPRGKARIVRIRRDKVAKLVEECESCEDCDGEGSYEEGTGGHVVTAAGKMDYRTFNYWMRQPAKFNAEKEAPEKDRCMCEHCGGTGKMPRAKILGVFIPSEIEYILNGKENEVVQEQVEKFKQLDMQQVKKEPVRGCGKRRPGFYAVARTGKKPTKDAKDLVKKLVKEGVIDPKSTEIHGDFIRFTRPVPHPGLKRFRGVKSFSLIPDAEEQAEMILDAM